MSIFDRFRRSESPARELPTLALPPLHAPARSLDRFAGGLEPIPLGIGAGGEPVDWDPSHTGALLVHGETGTGIAAFTRSVAEQCRTRGWQLLIADGKVTDFTGFEYAAGVSFIGAPSGGFGDPAASRCLAAVVIAHRIFAERQAAGDRDNAPVLLVINELAALIKTWNQQLGEADASAVLDLVNELVRNGGPARCHVLMATEGITHDHVLSEGAQVFLGAVNDQVAGSAADPAAVRVAARHARTAKVRGRGVLVTQADNGRQDVAAFQSFLSYSPDEAVRQGSPAEVRENWSRFKTEVSDAVPTLHPQLRLDPIAAGFPDIAACTWSELRVLPIVSE